HEVVDDDVAQRSDGVVEMAAVLDAERLRHRDLHGRQVVAAPNRLEHRARETQVDDLLHPHLCEVMVDAEELRLVDVPMELFCKLARGGEVVAEWLLHDDAGVLRQTRIRETLDNGRKEEGRDLEVEDGNARVADCSADTSVRRRVAEVALDVGESRSQAREDALVERLAGVDDRLARALDQLI